MCDNYWLQQIQREQHYLTHGCDKLKAAFEKDCKRANFTNTDVGRHIKVNVIEDLITTCEQEIEKALTMDTGTGKAKRHSMMKSLFAAWKLAKPKTHDQYSPAPMMIHVALQAMLDQAKVPESNNLLLVPGQRNPEIRPKLTVEEIQKFIGKEIIFQLKLSLIQEIVGGLLSAIEKDVSKDGSNHYYHHLNMDKRIAAVISEARLCPDPEESWLDVVVTEEMLEDKKTRPMAQRYQRAQRLLKAQLVKHTRETGLPPSIDEENQFRKDVIVKLKKRLKQTKKMADLVELLKWDTQLHLGNWIYGIVYDNSRLFTTDREVVYKEEKDGYGRAVLKQGKPKMTKTFHDFLYLSPAAEEIVGKYFLEERQSMMTPVPMLCPPRAITRDDVGGWIGDEASPTQRSPKGFLEMSELHLEFYNRQAAVPFKLNRFIFEIMRVMVDQDVPLKLGSFKPHRKREITPTALRFISKEETEGMSFTERKAYTINIVGEKRYNEVQEQSNAERKEQRDLQDAAIASWECYYMADRIKDDPQFFIPVRPDFRGRVIPRVSHIGYQQADHGKALILFAEEYPIDTKSKGWLLRQLANNFGNNVDKLSFTDRERKMQEPIVQEYIKAIATMNDEDGSFSLGMEAMRIIDGQDGDCWQFAAAAKEFYDIFVVKTKKTTNLPVTVDCSTSGQQIMAGWRKSDTLAARTNCVPLPEPADLYGAIWLKMLSLVPKDKPFTPDNLELLRDFGYGRKIIKGAFQGAQYGAGTDTQLAGLQEKIDKLKSSRLVVLSDEEVSLFYTYYPKALEKLCDLTTSNEWFSEVAARVALTGAKEILVPCPNGSIIRIRYPKTKMVRVDTFGYGNTAYTEKTGKLPRRQVSVSLPDLDLPPELKRWKSGLSPNVVHGAGDAALISLALWDYQMPFTSCHDSLGTYAGAPMEELCSRVREAYVKVADWDMFTYLLQINGVKMDSIPVIGDPSYDSKKALTASYLIS